MWKPVSKVEYRPLHAERQILVVACPLTGRAAEVERRWAERACAVAPDSSLFLRDVVRDLLANPHVRAVVFDGPACGRAAYDAFWQGDNVPDWGVEQEHLKLVRQFVDLWDDDCGIRSPMQPFWPARITYYDKEQ